MSRKSTFEEMIETLLQTAWWASLIVAAGAYIFFYSILPGILAGNKMMVSVAGMSKGIAPYSALFFCFIGGLAFLNSKRKAKLVDRQADIHSVRSLTWKQFEELVGEIGRRKGYQVLENFGGGADGGVDARFKKDGKLVLVQCKNWKAQKVNVKVVRELYGVIAAEGAHGGLVVTAGSYTKDALDFAKGKSIDLIDGQKLNEANLNVHLHRQELRSILEQEIAKSPVLAVSSSYKAKFFLLDLILRLNFLIEKIQQHFEIIPSIKELQLLTDHSKISRRQIPHVTCFP
jgi:restriction system protein